MFNTKESNKNTNPFRPGSWKLKIVHVLNTLAGFFLFFSRTHHSQNTASLNATRVACHLSLLPSSPSLECIGSADSVPGSNKMGHAF